MNEMVTTPDPTLLGSRFFDAELLSPASVTPRDDLSFAWGGTIRAAWHTMMTYGVRPTHVRPDRHSRV